MENVLNMAAKAYDAVWQRAPRPVAEFLSKATFLLKDRPPTWTARPPSRHFEVNGTRFEVLPFPEGTQGGLVFSADFEMAWAWRYAKSLPGPVEEMGLIERRHMPLILDLLDRHDIPVTWATVGHLCLDHCQRNGQIVHSEVRRLPHFENHFWRFQQGDWFDHDPCSSVTAAPAWYAPDLVSAIRHSKTRHELACHTFSHIDFSEEHCPAEVALDEIRACKLAFAPYGAMPRSMVFPANIAGHYSVLTQEGLICIRKRVQANVELSYPWRSPEGLWLIPDSAQVIQNFHWSAQSIRNRLVKYVDRAIEKGLVCSLWFHPVDMNPYVLSEVMSELLSYVNTCRRNGKLWIGTMEELANYCETAHSLHIERRAGNEVRLERRLDSIRFQPADIWLRSLDPQVELRLVEGAGAVLSNPTANTGLYRLSMTESPVRLQIYSNQ